MASAQQKPKSVAKKSGNNDDRPNKKAWKQGKPPEVRLAEERAKRKAAKESIK